MTLEDLHCDGKFSWDSFAELSLQTMNDRQSTDPILMDECLAFLFQRIHFDHILSFSSLPPSRFPLPKFMFSPSQTNTKSTPLPRDGDSKHKTHTNSDQTKP